MTGYIRTSEVIYTHNKTNGEKNNERTGRNEN
nr:MAG TPA: hypothetical protein [Caudoviricetes sp.]